MNKLKDFETIHYSALEKPKSLIPFCINNSYLEMNLFPLLQKPKLMYRDELSFVSAKTFWLHALNLHHPFADIEFTIKKHRGALCEYSYEKYKDVLSVVDEESAREELLSTLTNIVDKVGINQYHEDIMLSHMNYLLMGFWSEIEDKNVA